MPRIPPALTKIGATPGRGRRTAVLAAFALVIVFATALGLAALRQRHDGSEAGPARPDADHPSKVQPNADGGPAAGLFEIGREDSTFERKVRLGEFQKAHKDAICTNDKRDTNCILTSPPGDLCIDTAPTCTDGTYTFHDGVLTAFLVHYDAEMWKVLLDFATSQYATPRRGAGIIGEEVVEWGFRSGTLDFIHFVEPDAWGRPPRYPYSIAFGMGPYPLQGQSTDQSDKPAPADPDKEEVTEPHAATGGSAGSNSGRNWRGYTAKPNRRLIFQMPTRNTGFRTSTSIALHLDTMIATFDWNRSSERHSSSCTMVPIQFI